MAPAPLLTGASIPSALGSASLTRQQSLAESSFRAPCLQHASWSSGPPSVHSGAENAAHPSQQTLQHAKSQAQLLKSRPYGTGSRLGQVPAARARVGVQNPAGQGVRSRSSNALSDITNLSNRPANSKPKKERESAKPLRQPEAPACIDESKEQAMLHSAQLSTPQTSIQSCSEYAPQIFARLFLEERLFLPRSNYMDQQTDINAKMRAILIDWLIEVAMKYKLRPETLFLTVNIIDRYLSHAVVMRKKLQLLGVVAMFIAAKFEEINPPKVTDFVYITDNTYSKEDIFQWECQVLATLDFRIVVPTPAHFLDELLLANKCEDCHAELAKYILELALLDYRLICYTPSHLVAAALLASNIVIGRRPVWPASMIQTTRHADHVLQACADDMRSNFEAAATAQLQAVRKKYSLPQHRRVAQMDFSTLAI